MKEYIVIDFEATCVFPRDSSFRNEIIEFAAVRCDTQWNIISEFTRFVKPVLNPVLSDFCKKLTTITQDDIDQAAGFTAVLIDFNTWLNSSCGEKYFCSWGKYDKKQLISDCRLRKAQYPFNDIHYNLKQIAIKKAIKDYKMPPKIKGMSEVADFLKIKRTGTLHRGIDDCKNILQIVKRLEISEKELQEFLAAQEE
ncbi:MAG: exonuclease domain-containing protein [Endomicrobium sp.]|jgi:inhibitor of KinA sporulation pathway (predicted exonuclease)|nr:exonuclease domain-containing protein [Endomicrobium sp.]